MNPHTIAMMFVRPSVCLSGIGMHCDRTLHFSADLRLWLDSPIFWAPWHFFQFHLEERWGMDVQGRLKARPQSVISIHIPETVPQVSDSSGLG